ncbi:UDP-N-acetylglucosamine transferase subunit ALG14 -like protein [Brachionus plicatilis]|uniref:UDP-N-acetylglucosamine transferase subunit ALG14 n=1 Tax=Brachionus plicatilis TaxID=10195 RepID=A0A3M7QVW4_BRAPC|nr:UDP-N-acetylglucosamine transferase subunit ALG14 -like protein [Brachionus plicatilis]
MRIKTAVVLGSGGHTGEMVKLLSGMDLDLYRPIEFIVAETDNMSAQKIEQLRDQGKKFDYRINLIKRSRSVGQSYLTSIFTTILAIFYSIPLIYRIKPELLLVNGPGTCIPCCIITFVLSRILFLIPKCKIVYVESICRVKKFSLSGKILYSLKIADSLIVQWPELKEIYPQSVYLGQLV